MANKLYTKGLSSSILVSFKVTSSGASLTDITVTVKLPESVSSPSLTVTSKVKSPDFTSNSELDKLIF